jgi:hypothetical protein
MIKHKISITLCFLIFLFSCNSENSNKRALIGIWSIDSVYCNKEFSNKKFWSNLLLIEEDKLTFPKSIDNSYMETFISCNKKDWKFCFNDSLGYFLIFSNKCITNDTVYVKFINDKNIRQLRVELKFNSVVYYGRKGLTNYVEEENFFQELDSLSKNINLENLKQKDIDTTFINRFK